VPKGFHYQAGMYMQVCCDQVNPEEWHPFTISSAPHESEITFHINANDNLDWCSALRRKLVEEPTLSISNGQVTPKPGCRVNYEHYSHEEAVKGSHGVKILSSKPKKLARDGRPKETTLYSRPSSLDIIGADGSFASLHREAADVEEKGVSSDKKGENASELKAQLSLDSDALEKSIPLPLDVVRFRLDGPHGTPSELVWNHRIVVLVGAGIGVTPFASILKTVQVKREAFKAEQEFMKQQGKAAKNWQPCEKVYFNWLCRSQAEFEWFYDMLKSALDGPAKDSIEVSLFQTGTTELTSVKDFGKGFRQFFGRPNWKRIMDNLAKEHPEECIGVFLCGGPAIRKNLETSAAASMAGNPQANFIVHAENF
jgi:NADPH oxidase